MGEASDEAAMAARAAAAQLEEALTARGVVSEAKTLTISQVLLLGWWRYYLDDR